MLLHLLVAAGLATAAAPAPDATAPPAAEGPGRPAEATDPAGPTALSFLGFSQADALGAWRVTFRRPRPGGEVDTYTLVELLQVADHRRVAAFRQGAIRRLDAAGRRVPASAAALSADHPDWRDAHPAAMWDHLRRRHRFVAKRLDFGDPLVRVQADNDTALTAKADKKVLQVQGTAGRPLGYTVVARLFEGDMFPLGHYRVESGGPEAVPSGELEVYHSADGSCVAVVSRQRAQAGGPVATRAAVVLLPEDNPLGSTKVGFYNMLELQSRSVGNAFRKVWPKRAHDYDIYVGDFY